MYPPKGDHFQKVQSSWFKKNRSEVRFDLFRCQPGNLNPSGANRRIQTRNEWIPVIPGCCVRGLSGCAPLLVNTLKVSFSPSVYVSLCLQVPTGSVRLFIVSVLGLLQVRIFATRTVTHRRTTVAEGPIEGTPNAPNLTTESRVLTHSR